MLIAIVVIKQCKNSNAPAPKPKVTNNDRTKDPATNPTDRDKGFDRRTSLLEYSQHAKCRMQCRKISQAEVEEIMRDGKINYTKSDLQNARCPRYAVEGLTNDNQRVRIVYAQCNESTTVVTVIDLETDFKCELLYRVMREGFCDFVGSLVANNKLGGNHEYGDKNENQIWTDLKNELCNANTGNWLYNYSSVKDKPADLGYYVGYKIAEEYYKNAADKKQAITDIIEMTDPLKFLALSKYDQKPKK